MGKWGFFLGPWLTGVSQKIRRADEHFRAIEIELGRWSETNPYRLIRKINADGTRHSQIVRIRKRPPLVRLTDLASDCLQNLRSALDYLVYAIGVEESSSDPPPDFRILQFPIADTPDKFSKAKYRIASISGKAQAAIESVQPYHRPYPGLPPLLAILRVQGTPAADQMVLDPETVIREHMRKLGAKGGKIGGKRRLVTMTAAEREAVALKAATARWAKRRPK